MRAYATRALPWRLLLGWGAAAVGLLVVLDRDPWVLWPLEGVAVGVVAGAAAWCYDEPAAALIDTLPRSLAWRTAARSVGPVVLVGGWCAAVAATRNAYFAHAGYVLGQGVLAVVCGALLAIGSRRRGSTVPGRTVAAAFVCLAIFFALVRPWPDALPLLPYGPSGPWRASLAAWLAVVLVGVVSAAVPLEAVRSRGMVAAITHCRQAGAHGPASTVCPRRTGADGGAAGCGAPGPRT